MTPLIKRHLHKDPAEWDDEQMLDAVLWHLAYREESFPTDVAERMGYYCSIPSKVGQKDDIIAVQCAPAVNDWLMSKASLAPLRRLEQLTEKKIWIGDWIENDKPTP